MRHNLELAWKTLKAKWKLGALASILDGAFLLVIARLQLEMIMLMRDYLLTAANAVQELSQKLSQVEMINFNKHLLQNPMFMEAYASLLKITIWYCIGIFACWLLIKGAAWATTLYMSGKQFLKSWLKFAIVSMIGAVIAALLFITLISALSSSLFSPIPLAGPKAIIVIIAVLYVLLLYFATVCFITGKKGLALAIKKWKTLVPTFLLIWLGIIVLLLNSQFFLQLFLPAGIVVSVLLFPYLTYSRLLMTEVASAR